MVHKTKKNKTICIGHHYTQANTNNVNKTPVLLQTTGGKHEPDVCKMLSFASNDSEGKLDSMAEALNEAYQQQNDGINQLQILFLFAH